MSGNKFEKVKHRIAEYALVAAAATAGTYWAGDALIGDDGYLNNKTLNLDKETARGLNFKYQEPSALSYERLKENEDLIFACIAYVEEFKSCPYYCGASWTIGYGSTLDINNKPVNEESPSVDEKMAKAFVVSHLEKNVYPFILKNVKVPLNDNELIATAMFIYNIGGESFSGKNAEGKLIEGVNSSSFLQALNSGEKGYECAQKLTGFRSMGGSLARGLLKRHWVTGAVFCGKIDAAEILLLKPADFYQEKIKFYFQEKGGEKVDFYTPRYSPEKIEQFMSLNKNVEKSTLFTLDNETLKKFMTQFGIAAECSGIDVTLLLYERNAKHAKERIDTYKAKKDRNGALPEKPNFLKRYFGR